LFIWAQHESERKCTLAVFLKLKLIIRKALTKKKKKKAKSKKTKSVMQCGLCTKGRTAVRKVGKKSVREK